MLRGAFIGFGISTLLLMIPIVHLIVGPISPFIGGLVGGTTARATPAKAVGIGLLMGLFMAVPVIVVIAIGKAYPDLFPGRVEKVLPFIALGLIVWTGLLGSLGTLVGGRRSHRTTVWRMRIR